MAATLHVFPTKAQAEPSGGGHPISQHDEVCEWCGALPQEAHAQTCPDYEESFDDIQFCDACGCSYVTSCHCGERQVR